MLEMLYYLPAFLTGFFSAKYSLRGLHCRKVTACLILFGASAILLAISGSFNDDIHLYRIPSIVVTLCLMVSAQRYRPGRNLEEAPKMVREEQHGHIYFQPACRIPNPLQPGSENNPTITYLHRSVYHLHRVIHHTAMPVLSVQQDKLSVMGNRIVQDFPPNLLITHLTIRKLVGMQMQ